MILSDEHIQRQMDAAQLIIDPLRANAIQPASVDLSLGAQFAYWPTSAGRGSTIDLGRPHNEGPQMKVFEGPEYILGPMEFVLATTRETVKLGRNLCARIEGRSSIGRLGLVVHATAGFIDPGFEGQITLELFNLSPHAIRMEAGMGICQLAIEYTSSPVLRPYGSPELKSKYQGQTGVQTSRWRG